jgi:hypothetical protein
MEESKETACSRPRLYWLKGAAKLLRDPVTP